MEFCNNKEMRDKIAEAESETTALELLNAYQ
jgi:hypothetical protein